ncbi:SoxR reducing system RseC family protein [Acetobacterium tundrae]|uniref:Siderophore-interacting protein n=1 Tax=Acetobacterium tundrae TaxID=132932 RepID=A0ABR6WLB6_9FIRM|nr:SoxR reducing system RseC family protein [Acetobacterium tundrae]MBC3797298.1 siderophore-interacting protein [Acetobacterium tundrae]
MKQEEFGVVVEVDGSLAKVKAARHGDCENCGACPGDNAILMNVQNPISAKPGQRVTFEMQEASMVLAAFVVYFVPLLAAAAGAVLGGFVGNQLTQALVPFQIVGGIIGFGLSLIIVKAYDKAMKNDIKSLPVIVKILS